MLKVVMQDLLDDSEINALVARLGTLKTHLQDLKGKKKLLEPNQWDDMTAKGLLDEDVSYFAKIAKNVT